MSPHTPGCVRSAQPFAGCLAAADDAAIRRDSGSERRLREGGTSHQRVLDELRRDLAMRHLEGRAFGIQEVAFLLGFSDRSAFHHAFVRDRTAARC